MTDAPSTRVAPDESETDNWELGADIVWRRVPPHRNTTDKNFGRVRPGKDCFADHQNGTSMSVYDSMLMKDPRQLLKDLEGFGVVALSKKYLEDEIGLSVVPKPKPGEPAHMEVVGHKTDSKKSKMA